MSRSERIEQAARESVTRDMVAVMREAMRATVHGKKRIWLRYMSVPLAHLEDLEASIAALGVMTVSQMREASRVDALPPDPADETREAFTEAARALASKWFLHGDQEPGHHERAFRGAYQALLAAEREGE